MTPQTLIRSLRSKGWTQQKIANKTKLSQATISRLESGKTSALITGVFALVNLGLKK